MTEPLKRGTTSVGRDVDKAELLHTAVGVGNRSAARRTVWLLQTRRAAVRPVGTTGRDPLQGTSVHTSTWRMLTAAASQRPNAHPPTDKETNRGLCTERTTLDHKRDEAQTHAPARTTPGTARWVEGPATTHHATAFICDARGRGLCRGATWVTGSSGLETRGQGATAAGAGFLFCFFN